LATVSLTISPVNDAPVASDRAFSTAEDTPFSETLTAGDVDNLVLTFVLVGAAAHGVVVLDPSGSFTYTPLSDFYASDSFTYRVPDGLLDALLATVWLTVSPVNDAPVAGDGSFSTGEDTPLSQTLAASDVDDLVLTFVLVDGPAHGTLVLDPSGTFAYTPAVDYFGPDAFHYRAGDGQLVSNLATASLPTTPAND